VAVAHSGPVRVPLPLRAHNVVDLLLHQLGENTESHADAERQQPFLRYPDQPPQRLLHTLREHGFIVDRLRDRYVALHGGSSFDLGRSPVTLPSGADEPEGPPSHQSSTSPGTTSGDRTARLLGCPRVLNMQGAQTHDSEQMQGGPTVACERDL
jgi:hypothetical protein